MLLDLLDTSWAPILSAMLTSGAVIAVWFALAPAKSSKAVTSRLQGYVDRSELLDAGDMERSLSSRALMPFVHRVLTFLGGLMPQKDMAELSQNLTRAGDPGGLTVLDFVGLRIILAAAAVAAAIFLLGGNSMFDYVRNGLIAMLAGFMLPKLWLNQKIKKRKIEISRALPDALDMLTIGVEAGLAFESALLRVGDQWNNALSPGVPPCRQRNAHRHPTQRGTAAHGRSHRRRGSVHICRSTDSVQHTGCQHLPGSPYAGGPDAFETTPACRRDGARRYRQDCGSARVLHSALAVYCRSRPCRTAYRQSVKQREWCAVNGR